MHMPDKGATLNVDIKIPENGDRLDGLSAKKMTPNHVSRHGSRHVKPKRGNRYRRCGQRHRSELSSERGP